MREKTTKFTTHSLAAGIAGFCVFLFVKSLDLSITDPSIALPGMATFDGLDVSKRINAYYKGIFIFAAVFLVARYAFQRWLWQLDNILVLRRICQLLPFSAISWGIFKLLEGYDWDIQPVSIGAIITILLLTLFAFQWNVRKRHEAWFWVLQAGFAVLWAGVISSFWLNDHHIIWPIGLAVLLVISSLIVLKRVNEVGYQVLARFWAVFPLVSLFAFEGALILNQRGIGQNTSLLMPFLLSAGAGLWLMTNRKRYESLSRISNQNFYIPLFTVSFFAICAYQPIFQDRMELFEMANPAHSVMRVFRFNEWPFFDFLSSHMLSEQVMQYLYSGLNGYTDDLSFNTYQFVFAPLSAIVYLYFMRQILHSSYWALVLVLAFPFISIILDVGYFWTLVTVFCVHRVLVDPGLKSSSLLVIWSVFLVFWRIDIAAATVPALVVWVLLYALKNRFGKKVLLNWVMPVVIIGALGLTVLWISSLLLEENPTTSIKKALSYFGASQAHAFTKIAPDYRTFKFTFHHILLPLLVVLIFLNVLFKWLKNDFKRKEAFLVSALLVLCLFYFFNAQRGLVRHSFMEGSDRYISSFAYLIIPLFVLFHFKPRNRAFVFVLSGMLFVFPVRYQTLNYLRPNFMAIKNRFTHHRAFDFSSTIKRAKIVADEEKKKSIDEITAFLDEILEEDETFIDFSNTPMLYFYTQRRVPSYFNQYLQNTVTPYLQIENIKKLRSESIRYCLFSHVPDNWWDNMDGVPNTIRHGQICRYLYEHYHPWKTVAGFQIWRKSDSNDLTTIDSSNLYPRNYQLKHYPAFYRYDSLENYEQTEWAMGANQGEYVTRSFKAEIGTSLEIMLNNTAPDQEVSVIYFKGKEPIGQYLFTCYKDFKRYKVPLWTQYNWHLMQADGLLIRSKADLSILHTRLFRE